MEMFLMVLALSLLGVGVSAALFGAATRGVDEAPQPAERRVPVLAAPQFFAEAPPLVVPSQAQAPRVPLEALLLQIERHVQLEQAAAESFLMRPTREALHSRTASPLVH